MKLAYSLAGALVAAALAGSAALAAPRHQAPQQKTDSQLSQPIAVNPKADDPFGVQLANVKDIGERDPCKGLNFYSMEKQIALGKQLAQQVEQSARFVNDPAITSYVNLVGQNLVRHSDARVPFSFQVVDSNVVNAFSLPGGFTFVDSGLILKASDEAELAGVLAHEISHVIACHGAKQATKADIVQMAMIPVSIMLPYGWTGYGIYEGLNAAIPLAFLRFSRTDEAEADYLGVQYLWNAGYDPNAMVSFFEKIEAENRRNPGTIPKIFDTHPPTPDRILAVQKEISTLLPPRHEYIVDTSQFEAVKKRLERYEEGRELNGTKNGPTLRQQTQNGKKPNDKGPVLKRRNPNDPQQP